MERQEVHISSLVVHARPDHLKTVKNNIDHLSSAEVLWRIR